MILLLFYFIKMFVNITLLKKCGFIFNDISIWHMTATLAYEILELIPGKRIENYWVGCTIYSDIAWLYICIYTDTFWWILYAYE